MNAPIKPDLQKHIDGLNTTLSKYYTNLLINVNQSLQDMFKSFDIDKAFNFFGVHFRAGLADSNDGIISSHDYDVAKEKQEFWQKLEDEIKFDKAKSIFFDDSPSVLKLTY
jgi:hypothetical protein